MQYRRALIGVVASASLLGTAGAARASHDGERPDYSPCRDQADTVRAGYYDAADQADPRHELPTIYANGEAGSTEGNVGICSGGPSEETRRYLEVGNDSYGPYARGGAPEIPLEATTISPAPELGSITVGDDYVEVDGTEDNAPSAVVTQLDGYASAGLTEHNGGPGVCASGDYDHDHFIENDNAKDCNEEFVTNELPED